MQIPYGRKYSNAMSFKDQTAYVIKKIRNTASNFQAPTYIEKGNKRQKKIWDGKKRGSRGLCCVWHLLCLLHFWPYNTSYKDK